MEDKNQRLRRFLASLGPQGICPCPGVPMLAPRSPPVPSVDKKPYILSPVCTQAPSPPQPGQEHQPTPPLAGSLLPLRPPSAQSCSPLSPCPRPRQTAILGRLLREEDARALCVRTVGRGSAVLKGLRPGGPSSRGGRGRPCLQDWVTTEQRDSVLPEGPPISGPHPRLTFHPSVPQDWLPS